tara:strand:- start:105 stop:503 length:399 start_codon:yes stop_codon:yes gene_type:complete
MDVLSEYRKAKDILAAAEINEAWLTVVIPEPRYMLLDETANLLDSIDRVEEKALVRGFSNAKLISTVKSRWIYWLDSVDEIPVKIRRDIKKNLARRPMEDAARWFYVGCLLQFTMNVLIRIKEEEEQCQKQQ